MESPIKLEVSTAVVENIVQLTVVVLIVDVPVIVPIKNEVGSNELELIEPIAVKLVIMTVVAV